MLIVFIVLGSERSVPSVFRALLTAEALVADSSRYSEGCEANVCVRNADRLPPCCCDIISNTAECGMLWASPEASFQTPFS